jgi:hypothetical protein
MATYALTDLWDPKLQRISRFLRSKGQKKNSRNENLEKKLEINFTKKICEVHPKKT